LSSTAVEKLVSTTQTKNVSVFKFLSNIVHLKTQIVFESKVTMVRRKTLAKNLNKARKSNRKLKRKLAKFKVQLNQLQFLIKTLTKKAKRNE